MTTHAFLAFEAIEIATRVMVVAHFAVRAARVLARTHLAASALVAWTEADLDAPR